MVFNGNPASNSNQNYVSPGTTVKLFVWLSSDSDDTNVLWFKDGRPLISEGNLKIGREENIYYLEIEGSTVQDSGEYTCTANSVGGACFCTASVEVTGIIFVEFPPLYSSLIYGLHLCCSCSLLDLANAITAG